MAQPSVRPTQWPLPPFSPDSLISLPGLSASQNTATLAATAATGRVAINLNGAVQVELYNAGPNDVFVAFGDNTVVATVPAVSAGSYPVGVGQCKLVTLLNPDKITNMAAICAATQTAALFASPGAGGS